MERWSELIETVQVSHGVVTRLQLVGAGVSPARIDQLRKTGRLVDAHRGVYRIGGAPPTFASEVTAAIRAFPESTWASHHTAARLWDLRVAARDRLVQVTRPVGLSGQRTGVHIHRSTLLPSHHLTIKDGIPVTTPTRTLFDLARTTGDLPLDRAIARATQARLCTVGGLYRVMFELGGRGRPGTQRLRAVLERWDAEEPPTESELDSVGRALLGRVPGIEWQVPMADEQGHIRQVDALLGRARVVIEFDGAVFHDPPRARALDDAHDRRLVRLGYRVIRFGWGDLTRRDDITLAEVEHLAAGVPLRRSA